MKIQAVSFYRPKCNISSNKNIRNSLNIVTEQPRYTVEFKGKHTFAKGFAGICGGLGLLGAVGGILIMTGGLGAAALPWIAGYGAASAGAGAIVGHQLDKADKDESIKDKK